MLLDTNIVIDYLRGNAGAGQFVGTLEEHPSLSTVTIAELFAGLRSQRAEAIARAFVQECNVFPVSRAITEIAGASIRHYREHNLNIADAIIAATAEHHEVPLATLNVRHFPMFKRLKPAY